MSIPKTRAEHDLLEKQLARLGSMTLDQVIWGESLTDEIGSGHIDAVKQILSDMEDCAMKLTDYMQP